MAHPYQETGSGVLCGYYRTGNKKVSREHVSRLLGVSVPSFERAIRREDWDRVKQQIAVKRAFGQDGCAFRERDNQMHGTDAASPALDGATQIPRETVGVPAGEIPHGLRNAEHIEHLETEKIRGRNFLRQPDMLDLANISALKGTAPMISI